MDKVVCKITLEELKKQKIQWAQKCRLDAIELAKSGKWEDFCEFVITHYESMAFAVGAFFENIPDTMKYKFLIDCYESHGDSIPVVRRYVRQMRKWGAPELPHCMKILDEIIIFRAGAEDITKAKYRISWTHDINTALFFLKRPQSFGMRKLYAGRIKKQKILAYNNNRSEYEIMQYNSVYDVRDITETAVR